MMPWRDIRLITIDLDDTLWPCVPAIEAAEQWLHSWLEAVAPDLAAAYDLDTLRAHRLEVKQGCPDIAHDITAVRIRSLELLLDAFGYPRSLAKEGVDGFVDARSRVAPYPEVDQALRALSDRFCLVSVTNGNAEIAKTPLRGRFHLSLSAAGVGAAKPAPDMFLQALSWAGIQPGQALHVGDDPALDVLAARSIGMGTVWVNRDGKDWPEGVEPADLSVAELTVLVSILGGAHSGSGSRPSE